jgi:hypothetical protein
MEIMQSEMPLRTAIHYAPETLAENDLERQFSS